jgi:ABC-2 type transport system permease protein
VVAALLLLVDGILFQTNALGVSRAMSADILRAFFMFTGIVVQIAGIVLAVRLVAEERQQQTIVLLNTSPVRDFEIILGKFFAALVFLTGMLLLSLYMPLLIMVNGRIAVSQLVVGYLGLILLGASSLAIGIFASSLARQQLIALAVGATINGVMVLLFPLAMRLDPPLKDIFQQLDLWQVHFFASSRASIFNSTDLIYYLAVVYFFLLLATKTASPWWFSALFATGLALVFLGERPFHHIDTAQLVFTGAGTLLLVAITGLRLWTFVATADSRRAVERTLLISQVSALVALGLYTLTTAWGQGLLGVDTMEPEGIERFVVPMSVLWSILMVVSVVLMLMVEL